MTIPSTHPALEMWLSGATYKEIGGRYNVGPERARQIVMGQAACVDALRRNDLVGSWSGLEPRARRVASFLAIAAEQADARYRQRQDVQDVLRAMKAEERLAYLRAEAHRLVSVSTAILNSMTDWEVLDDAF